jgi:hypothetical protein
LGFESLFPNRKDSMTTYVEKLQAWFEDQRANHGLVDMKFFPHYMTVPGHAPIKLFEGPDPTEEQLAESVYRLVTGEIPTIDVSDQNL